MASKKAQRKLKTTASFTGRIKLFEKWSKGKIDSEKSLQSSRKIKSLEISRFTSHIISDDNSDEDKIDKVKDELEPDHE